MIRVQSDAELTKLRQALRPATSFPGLLERRQQHRHERRDDRRHDQQFDQAERAPPARIPIRSRAPKCAARAAGMHDLPPL